MEIREVIQGHRTEAELEPVGSPVSLLEGWLSFTYCMVAQTLESSRGVVCLGLALSMWKFQGQGSNLPHSCDLSYRSDNARSLTCWANQELPIIPVSDKRTQVMTQSALAPCFTCSETQNPSEMLYLSSKTQRSNLPRMRKHVCLTFEMGKQWGPTIQHRELYSISWHRPWWWKII